MAVRALFAHLGFQGLTAERQIPKNAGRTLQIYTYNLSPFTASVSAAGTDVGGGVSDTAPPTAVEGTVGTPITPTEASIQAVLGQYVDYVNVSDFALAVDIGKPLEQLSEMLGYRGALVVDTLIQQGYDAAVSTDSTASVQVPDGSYVTRAVINTAVATIRGKNGRPFPGGRHRGIMHQMVHIKSGYIGEHLSEKTPRKDVRFLNESVETNTPDKPGFGLMIESELHGDVQSAPVVTQKAKTHLPYILSDIANDLTANGVLDTEKFTREGQKWIEAGLAEDNEIIPIAA